jgi:hypothetical protein
MDLRVASERTFSHRMGRYYLRFFEKGIEVDWHQLDGYTLDYIVEHVLDMCGPSYHSQGYFDVYEDGNDMCLAYSLYNKPAPIPKGLATTYIEFGWGKDRKDLKLIGDQLPVDEEYKFQITYC